MAGGEEEVEDKDCTGADGFEDVECTALID